ncbi:MAG TPA: diaminopimelate epimerase [Acidimicrobiia bacterium]|nr:diaminopimelate epimerase [Acidimicrobiia bacterium]
MTALTMHKLHATGNDFLVCETGVASPDVVARVCNRHTGVGADGLIVLGAPATPDADCSMTLSNADGGEAEMSGNGIRCLAWVAHRRGYGDGKRLVVDTAAGRREVDLDVDPDTGDVRAATVDMGPVTFEPSEIPLDALSPFGLTATFHGTRYEGDAAGMGNPHFVIVRDEHPRTARVTQHGPHLELDKRFPNRTNVEFVAATDGEEDAVDMRVWERGVGETLSCGTGACAAAAVAHRRGLVGERVTVHVPGGDLVVELGPTIRLGGPVVHVFDTTIEVGDDGSTRS